MLRVAPAPAVFSTWSVENETLPDDAVFDSVRADATPLVQSGSSRSLRRHASHPDDARCDADTMRGHILIDGYPDVSQRLIGAKGTVVVEYDVPPESRGCRIRIECHRHLRPEGVSVNATLERDRR